ncbi:ATP-dependent DNA ligase [Minicystis rosea]|nr:ATP-dependent DNA ligase [Minicystis rosea]
MRIIQTDDVRAWLSKAKDLGEMTRSIGPKRFEDEYLSRAIGLPLHLRLAVEKIGAERGETPVTALDSIPFYSLCRGLFLPLSALAPERVAQLFGLRVEPPPDTAGREALLLQFFEKDVGLSIAQKIACVLGDPFHGRRGTLRRDSLVRLLMSTRLVGQREVVDRLSMVGDVAVLFAESRQEMRSDPALTAAEVLEALRFLPKERRNRKFDLARSILERCGRLEAYFLAKLLLRRAGFGFEYQGEVLTRALAKRFGASEEAVGHAMALTDAFHVARVLESEGPAGLRAIQLKPLVPVRPALANGTTDEIARYPVWVERKYDGIRLMLHKATDATGSVLVAAYTRARHDWIELVRGLDTTCRTIPARSTIIDGELHGTVVDLEGVRPATVYEVYGYLQGDRSMPVTLKFAAFDLIYLNGRDLTSFPLHERRRVLGGLLAPLGGFPLPVPLSMSEGQLAEDRDDVNRLFYHFRAQGYEGVIAKDLAGAYRLAERDPTWLKRKPEITLDLVLLGAVFAVTSKDNVGIFGSYVIGARRPDGSFEDVGDVAGVDKIRDAEIQSEIVRDGLATGRRVERKSASGVRAGLELLPRIVVTVRFEGIARDTGDGRLALRGPKLVAIRADKPAGEADTTAEIEALYLRQRVG